MVMKLKIVTTVNAYSTTKQEEIVLNVEFFFNEAKTSLTGLFGRGKSYRFVSPTC